MIFSGFNNLHFRTKLSIVGGFFLVLGLAGTIIISQQTQENRSHAGSGGTGNCDTVNASFGDLNSDNCTIQSGFNGSIFGTNDTIMGGLGGNITGNNNLIMGGENGSISGNGNEVCGGLNGGITGNNNIIHGTVGGPINGTGNQISFIGICGTIRQPTAAPTVAPTPTPQFSQGITWYSDGTQTKTGPAGASVKVFATQTPASTYGYQLVSGTDGGNPATPCSQNISILNNAAVHPGTNGLIPAVTGTLPGFSGSAQICFKEVSPGQGVTTPLNYTVLESPTPTPVHPTPTSIPPPVPTPVSCSAPLNFAGTAGPTGSGRWDFTWSAAANATSYNLYYAISPGQPGSLYSGPFTTTSGSAFSLNSNTQYNFAIRATCNSIESVNSNIVEVSLIQPTATPTPLLPTPTPTPLPGDTSLAFNVLLHGIGHGGDSANPNGGGNQNPLHPQRSIKIEVLDQQNQLIVTKDGNIGFNSAQGNFTGTINVGNTLTSGLYTIKIKPAQFLRKLIPGIQNITAGVTNQLPQVVLINGDINGDNSLSILDYNILIGCYSDFLPPASCTPGNKLLADLDDDGAVNQFDYNLFLRELTNLQGQ